MKNDLLRLALVPFLASLPLAVHAGILTTGELTLAKTGARIGVYEEVRTVMRTVVGDLGKTGESVNDLSRAISAMDRSQRASLYKRMIVEAKVPPATIQKLDAAAGGRLTIEEINALSKEAGMVLVEGSEAAGHEGDTLAGSLKRDKAGKMHVSPSPNPSTGFVKNQHVKFESGGETIEGEIVSVHSDSPYPDERYDVFITVRTPSGEVKSINTSNGTARRLDNLPPTTSSTANSDATTPQTREAPPVQYTPEFRVNRHVKYQSGGETIEGEIVSVQTSSPNPDERYDTVLMVKTSSGEVKRINASINVGSFVDPGR